MVMGPPARLTDRHVACLLRAARVYSVQLRSEIQRQEELERGGSIIATADLETKRFEYACLQQAIRLLWQQHAAR